ncbi:MAG: hypothetical protein JNK06_15930 [Candidatus Accumulibacter phosphatis]|uniref:hypothetical protein n=1 Tax=Candidatus Accumulibacter phosphatis TaxID=327160 RepID=UPI001A568C72|nr:hypothetical protein [Candidatus Accumulibacter phosphatis]
MSTMEKIVEEVQTLPETDAREVLDFVGYLKSRRAQAMAATAHMSEFDPFGAVFDGKFNRDECHDREALR